MFQADMKRLVSGLGAYAGALMVAASITFMPLGPAHAQNRTLPDFTDLVEQVGPSVVNIRTLEKASARSAV